MKTKQKKNLQFLQAFTKIHENSTKKKINRNRSIDQTDESSYRNHRSNIKKKEEEEDPHRYRIGSRVAKEFFASQLFRFCSLALAFDPSKLRRPITRVTLNSRKQRKSDGLWHSTSLSVIHNGMDGVAVTDLCLHV